MVYTMSSTKSSLICLAMMAFSARAFAFNGGSNKGYSHALVATVNVLHYNSECSPMIHVLLLNIDYCLSLSVSLSVAVLRTFNSRAVSRSSSKVRHKKRNHSRRIRASSAFMIALLFSDDYCITVAAFK